MIRYPFLKKQYVPSVRTSLAVLVVGCILPIAVMAAFLIFSFYQRAQTQLSMNAISRVRAMTSLVDRDFANTQAALQALSTSPLLAKGNLAGFHAQAVEALRNMQAETIVLLDTSGQLLLSTRRPFGMPLPKIANPPLLKRTLETGKAGISDLFWGPVVGHLIFTIAVPVKRDGVTIYSLNAIVAPAQLATVLTEQKLPDSWRGVIADSTGSVVARTHDIDIFLGKKITPDLLRRMSISDEDGFESSVVLHSVWNLSGCLLE